MNKFTLENTALVLIDHQVGTINWAGSVTPEQREEVKMWARLLARFAKGVKMPIVLTSSMETAAQGLLLPEFQEIMPEEYEKRVKRTGIINAWDDPNFADAVRGTGRKNLLMSGLTTDVCLVPPALSAKAEGFNVVALFDSSAACSLIGEVNSRQLLEAADVPVMSTLPALTGILGDYTKPEAAVFFEVCERENMYELLGKGSVR